jgi:hypothetical protein
MQSGSPPSSHAFIRGTAALDVERGSLRESLGGLRNLAELLHSLRVASRPLSAVLPGALDACQALRRAAHEILTAARGALAAHAAADELGAFVLPRITELEQALAVAAEKPLSVKTRLSLEEQVTRLSQELDTARALFDLLVDSIAARPVRLDVLDLVRHSFAGPASARGGAPRNMLHAKLRADSPGMELEVDSRVVTSLLAFAAELVAGASSVPQIHARATEDGGCQIVVSREIAVTGEDLVLQRRGVIPPTLACVTAAARESGAALQLSPDGSQLSLLFSRAYPARQIDGVG